MQDEPALRMFENDTKAFIAVQMQLALEGVVRDGFTLSQKRWIKPNVVQEVLCRKGAPLIREILNSMNSEATRRVRQMDERTIWSIYWDVRSNAPDVAPSIFLLLSELNDPPYAASFA